MEQNKDQVGAAVRGEAVAWAVTAQRGGIHKLSITKDLADRKAAKWREEWPDNGCAVRPLVFGDVPVSAGDADAPSEPSGLTFDQWLDRKDENGWTEREAPCGEFRDMLRGWNAAMKFGKSRAADALDSQPTDGGVRNG